MARVDEFGNTIYDEPEPSPLIPAATAPPIYPGPPGTSYTNFDNQAQTVPATPPVNPNQAEYAALWAQSGKNPQQFVQGLIDKLGLKGRQTDPTALNTIARALQTVGVNATLDQRGDQYHKGLMIDGHFVKLIDGSDKWMWGMDADKQPEGGGGGPAKDPAGYYAGIKPFDYPDFVPPNFNTPKFNAPSPFSYPEFVLPTGQQVLDEDPGYGFREARGQRALRNEASADGLLKTGGFEKSMLDWVSGLASQEYGNAASRRFGSWQANRGAASEDYDRLWKNTLTNYSLDYTGEADKFNRALTTYGVNNKNAATQFGFGLDLAGGKSGQANNNFNQLLSLYDISTRDLPKYTPPSLNYGV